MPPERHQIVRQAYPEKWYATGRGRAHVPGASATRRRRDWRPVRVDFVDHMPRQYPASLPPFPEKQTRHLFAHILRETRLLSRCPLVVDTGVLQKRLNSFYDRQMHIAVQHHMPEFMGKRKAA